MGIPEKKGKGFFGDVNFSPDGEPVEYDEDVRRSPLGPTRKIESVDLLIDEETEDDEFGAELDEFVEKMQSEPPAEEEPDTGKEDEK